MTTRRTQAVAHDHRQVDHVRRGGRRITPQAGHRNPRSPAASAVIDLVQRGAGNRAVSRWLDGRRRPDGRGHSIQRFVGHEHESLGDVTGADVDIGNGVILTWGQIVALAGDEFGTFEELQTATASDDGRRRIRAALTHAGVKGPIPATLPEPADEDQAKADMAAQETAAIMLALENVAHFGAGGDALATWRNHHARALHQAVSAGLSGDEAAFQHAQALEAFGQHYLTDMFSGGHVRTPRREIMAFYADRAEGMANALLTAVRTRLENALVAQVMAQLPPLIRGNRAQREAQAMVRATLDERLQEAMQEAGGREKFVQTFGLAIAGAVSGAMHDSEGRQGVVVTSEAHPAPWLAMGDAMLDTPLDPQGVSRDQAEQAVLAAREELLAARHAGRREAEIQRLVPEAPPAVVYFAFDSSQVEGGNESAALAAGAYLHVHPDSYVELIGHTDPLGRHRYNQGLGQRRAHAVQELLLKGGATPEQVVTTSQGEDSLVATDPGSYHENRRVELQWHNVPSPVCPPEDQGEQSADSARERAQAIVDELGPPYATVERFVPQELPEMNEPLPEWRWGQMSPDLVTELDTWIIEHVGPHTDSVTQAVPETVNEDVDFIGTITVTPRRFVEGIVAELMRNPSRTLGNLIGEQPGG